MNKTFPGLYLSSSQFPTEEGKEQFKPNYPKGWSPTVFQSNSGFGLLYRSSFDQSEREVFLHDGIEVEFVDFWPNSNCIRASYTEVTGVGLSELHTLLIHISQVDLESLKKMELWKYLSEDTKTKLETDDFKDIKIRTEEIVEVDTSKKGRKRNPEFANLPRELTCATKYCGQKMAYISPTMLIAKAKEKGITPQEYADTWKCSECEPHKRRGRATSAKWEGFAKELTCSCGSILKQHPNITTKLAERAGITFEQYVAAYKCKACRGESTNTTTTRGRKMSPNSPWFGKAKELKCACGKVQPQHASITDSQAKKAGKTFEEYVASWQCMNCRPAGAKRVRDGSSFGKSRVANPKFANIPKETACTICGTVVKLVPSNIIGKAEILGMTVEELIKGYRCRRCGGKLKKGQKSETVA